MKKVKPAIKCSKNVACFLYMLRRSELGVMADWPEQGYNVIVGSTPKKPILMTSYADHPRKAVKIREGLTSTAAGGYQILKGIYDPYKIQLKLPDFSPLSQDKIALQLIRECKALDDIEAGRIESAIVKCKSRWASLPGAGYNQNEHRLSDLVQIYKEAAEHGDF